MSKFQILDEKRYPLQVKQIDHNLLPYWRYEHRATLGSNFKQFMVFVDNLESKVYIEEITTGSLLMVEDKNLWHDLYHFAKEKGFCNVMPPLAKAALERFA